MRLAQVIALFALLAFLVVACQSAPSTQQAAPPTPAPLPTYTPFPTYTPYPTYTPAPSPAPKNSLPSEQREDLIWPFGVRDDVIPVEDAAAFMGEQVVVEGIVNRTHNSGNAVFINFSANGKDLFTAVIFPDDWPKFPAPPENLFAEKLVRIEGVIKEYKGTPEIIITSPAQIEVALTLGQPVFPQCDCQKNAPAETATPHPSPTEKIPEQSTTAATATAVIEPTAPPAVEPTATELVEPTVTEEIEPAATPEPTATPESNAQPQVIPWQEAADFEGKTVTVAGQVVGTYNSGKVVFLNFDQNYQDTFKVVIFPDSWPLFPEAPEEYYNGKSVQVTGKIKLYQNVPEIIVDHPDQITIVE